MAEVDALSVHNDDGMNAFDACRMLLEVGDLALQLMRRRPVVVTFEPRDVLSPALPQRISSICVHAEVALAEEHADAVGMLIAVAQHDGARVVGGAVLANDELYGNGACWARTLSMACAMNRPWL